MDNPSSQNYSSPALLQMGYGDPEGKRVLDLEKSLGTITAGGNKFGLAAACIKKAYNISNEDNVKTPLSTITSQSNHHTLMTAFLAVNNTGHSGRDLTTPMKTITTGGHQMLATAFLNKNYGGFYTGAGVDPRNPIDTITQVDHHSLTTAFISKADSVPTLPLSSNGSCTDSVNHEASKLYEGVEQNKDYEGRNPEIQLFFENFVDEPVLEKKNAAFLTKYYGNEVGQDLHSPLHTIPTKDRFGLVQIEGENYEIVDITLRMLQPKELAKAQGVPDSYILDQDKDGKKISKAKQVARIGNMVVPNCAEALVRANLPELCSESPYQEQVELLNADFGWHG